MTNLLLRASLAYKAVALSLMMGEATDVSRKMDLQAPVPITQNAIKASFIRIPNQGVSGTLTTISNFHFCFYQGKMFSISRLADDGFEVPKLSEYPAMAGKKPVIDEKGALDLAVGWLSKMSFDLPAFEKTAIRKVEQINSEAFGSLPLFSIVWNDTNQNGNVELEIDGLSRTFNFIRFNESALKYLKRSSLVITNTAELQARPDPPLKKLQPSQGK